MYRTLRLFPVCLAVACGAGGRTAEGPTGPDTLVLEPVDTIGIELGDSSYVFGMIWQARVDASGRLLVLDNQSCNVRVFSSDGSFLGSAGGRGSGPGELQFPMGMATFSDGSFAVVDPLSGSVVFYDDDLSYSRSLTGFFPSPPMRLAAVDSGRFVAIQPTIDEVGGRMIVRTVLGRWSGSEGPELVYLSSEAEMGGGEGIRLQGPEYVLDGCRDGRAAAALSAPDVYRIDCFDSEGAILFSIEEDWEPVAKTEEELARGVNAVAISVADGSASAETRNVEDTEPYHVAVSDLFFGPGGDLWARMGSDSIPTFRIYDGSGSLSGVAVIPALYPDSGGEWDVSVSPEGFAAWQTDPGTFPMVIRLGPQER